MFLIFASIAFFVSKGDYGWTMFWILAYLWFYSDDDVVRKAETSALRERIEKLEKEVDNEYR